MKIAIGAAGTGGHVIPALHLATYAKKQGHDVVWFGTQKGLESRLVKNCPLYFLPAKGVRGKSKVQALLGLVFLGLGFLKSLYLLLCNRPDCVLVMGGYISLPVGLAAVVLGIPLVLHEQNATPGSANRLLARFAKKILLGLPGPFAKGPYQHKVKWVGNPVGTALSTLGKQATKSHQGPLRLLVLGGSLGAKAINQQVLTLLQKLPEDKRPEVWHQCGQAHMQSVHAAYLQAGLEVKVSGFIDDMSKAYLWADCIIARAGAMSVSELAAVGLRAFLIPFPFAIDDHQSKNAAWFCEQVPGSVWVAEKDLTEQALQDWLAVQKVGHRVPSKQSALSETLILESIKESSY